MSARGLVALATVALLSGTAGAQTPAYTPYIWASVATRGMGTVTGIAIAPTKPFDVYVKTDVGGAYRYDRTHDRWLPLLDAITLGGPPLDGTAQGVGVEAVATDPVKPGTAYVVVQYASGQTGSPPYAQYTYSGEVLRTTDQGRTWTPLGLAPHHIVINPNGGFRSDTGERVAIDPKHTASLFFASRENGLWRKEGAADWTQVGGLPDPTTLPGYYANGQPNPDQAGFTFVAFDNSKPSGLANSAVIYVGVTGTGIWASRDGGITWVNTGGPVDAQRGTVARDGTLYVSGLTGLHKLTSAGWTDITPLPSREYYSVTVDPIAPASVITISNNLVFRSTDAGASWSTQRLFMGSNDPQAGTPVNPSAPGYYLDFASNYASAVAVDPANPKAVWWTNGFGVARTDDVAVAAPVWSWHMVNLEELVVNVIRVPPLPKSKGGADLLTGVDDMLGFRYADRTKVPAQHFNPVGIAVPPNSQWANGNWTVFPVPFPHVAGVTGMDYAYRAPARAVFVGQHQFEFIGIHGTSVDNGQSWQAFPALPQDTLYDGNGNAYAASAIAGQVAMSPTNPSNIIWAPSYGSFPQVTLDGGQHWQLMLNADHGPPPTPGGPPTTASTHYQYLQPTFSNSISPYLISPLLTADRADPKGTTFYYLAFTTLFYTHDGGATWHQGASGPNFPAFVAHTQLLSNPATVGDLWLVFTRNANDLRVNQLYHSVDGGLSFAAVPGVTSCDHATFGAPTVTGGPPTLFISGRVGTDSTDALYRSPDLGRSWTRISNPAAEAFPGIQALEADMRTAGLLYVGLAGRGVVYGSPGGR